MDPLGLNLPRPPSLAEVEDNLFKLGISTRNEKEEFKPFIEIMNELAKSFASQIDITVGGQYVLKDQ